MISQLDKTFYENIKNITLHIQLQNKRIKFTEDEVDQSNLIDYLKILEEVLYQNITSTMTGEMSDEDRFYLNERDRIDIMSLCEVDYELFDFYCEESDCSNPICKSRLESEMN